MTAAAPSSIDGDVVPVLCGVGDDLTPVMTLDRIGPATAAIIAMAAALAPFPPARNNYPGLRRIVGERDAAAFAYVVALLREATPYLAGAFDLDGFDLVEASFSLVTASAATLSEVQRAPHFDDVSPDHYAVMHYVAPCAGTAFFRHRATGIEVVTPATVDRYVAAARATAAPTGYVAGDTAGYECIGRVEGRAGRLVAYPAALLHSGVIPPSFVGSDDPAVGRLTTNIFIRARRPGP